MTPKIEILERQLLSDNWYKLHKIVYSVTKTDGTSSIQHREAYDRGNGAVILLYNQETSTVILTKQFRLVTYINGNADGMMIEACAGLLDLDEPERCIKRETEEETGYRIGEVTRVFEAYMSPGSVTELLHFFIAPYTAEMKVSEGGGLEEEQEHIEVMEVLFATALAMVKTGEIKDAKTIMLLQYLALNQVFDASFSEGRRGN